MPSTPALVRPVCFTRSSATTRTMQGGYSIAPEETKPKFLSVSHTTSWIFSGGGSRAADIPAIAASIYLQSASMGKEKNTSSWKIMTENKAKKKPPVSCWAHTAPQQSGASVFLLWFKPSGTKPIDKAERQQASQATLKSLSLMCFSPAFSYNLQYYYSDAQHHRI